jgi:hypothetical protein
VSFSLILPASILSNKAIRIGNLIVLAAGNTLSPLSDWGQSARILIELLLQEKIAVKY